jgi:hypothetical protein
VRDRRLAPLWALLLALLLADLLPPAGVAAAAPTPGCANSHFWTCRHNLGTLRPTSVTSEGLSLFMMDPPAGRIEQLRFNQDGSFTQIPLPWLPIADAVALTREESGAPFNPNPAAAFGSLVLGPRAFYAIVTLPDPALGIDATVPYLFRADRIPTAISGGWRFLRQTAGGADQGLASVVMNRTVWMLRSCSQVCLDARRKGRNAAFAVDWQPLATENIRILQPPGPTIDLGDTVRARPAAGVTATAEAIYVFGGQETPNTATRIPLKNGLPGKPEQMTDLPVARRAATALVHGTLIYLVGGTDPARPTDPVIERGRIEAWSDPRGGTVRGHVRKWEPLPSPSLPTGVTIATATFARGQLWIIRSDGWIQTMDVGAVAPGQTRLTWDQTEAVTRHKLANGSLGPAVTSHPVPPQPIKVRRGDVIELKIDWSYLGAQTFEGVNVQIAGVLSDTGIRRSAPFITARQASFPSASLLPPGGPGPQLELTAVIPEVVTDVARNRKVPDRRSEYNATVQLVTASGQKLGPLQRLRFVVERTPTA